MSLQTDLHCRSGCGFYGNPEWQWFCSKCWREHLRKAGSPTRPVARPLVQPVKSTPSLSSHFTKQDSAASALSPRRHFLAPQSSFSKFEDKKKRQSLDKNIKQIFQGRSFGGSKDSPEKVARHKSSSFAGADKKLRPDYPPEVKQVSQEFAAYLKKRLETQGVSDISKQVKGLVDKLTRATANLPIHQSACQEQIDDLSAVVQEFYQQLQRRLETKEYYRNLSEDEVKGILDFAEKYSMLCLYKQLFCPPYTNDEEKDLELQNKIRSLNWISTQELKCPLNESSQEVRDLFNEAIHDILEVDGKMAPQDKLDCVVRCSKKVFDMLKVSNENPASADDFLPCLIYICLKANPPRIQSNINFITRFCNENKLRMGEGGYFFANLCCAVSFIENMTAESINMDPDEYDSYVSGRAVPPGSWHSSMLTCEGLQVMSQNVKTLMQVKARLMRTHEEALKLQESMTTFQRDIEMEVRAVLLRTPFELPELKAPVSVDSESNDDLDNMKSLPAPLVPQTVPIFDITESSPASQTGVTEKGDSASNTSLRLEDFWSVSSNCGDNSSLLSLDMSNLSGTLSTSMDDDKQDVMSIESSSHPTVSTYVGFSAQSFSIPSIACESDFSHAAAVNRAQSPPESSSAAMSPVASPPSMTGEVSSDTEVGDARCHMSSSADSTSDVSDTSSSSPIISTTCRPGSSTSSETGPKTPDRVEE